MKARPGGMFVSDFASHYPGARLYPPGDMVLHSGQNEEWFLVVEVATTRSGSFKTDGLRVHWTAGDSHGTSDFPYEFVLNAA
jgi:hypothetical protein